MPRANAEEAALIPEVDVLVADSLADVCGWLRGAQELLPGRIGMVSGLFFGFAFGMGGIGAAVLGKIADATSIEFVYRVCAYLPAIGLLAGFLPVTGRGRKAAG